MGKLHSVLMSNTLSVLLLTLSASAHAEGWFSRLITGNTSDESVSATGLYREHCGGCHIAYRPHLLPAISWERLMSDPENHFGEKLVFSPKDLAAIRNYLLDNGAGRTPDPLAARIMAAQGEQAWPVRITDMIFFRQRHQTVVTDAPGRCEQCHAGAARGDYTADSH